MAEHHLPTPASHKPGAGGPYARPAFPHLALTPAPSRTPKPRDKGASMLSWLLP